MNKKILLLQLKLTVVFVFLFHSHLCGFIIPSSTFPLLMNKPLSDKVGYSLVFRFSLPTDTKGLSYGQYIGVIFPTRMGSMELYSGTLLRNDDQTFTSRFSCGLRDSEGLISYNMKADLAGSGVNVIQENNVLFCKFDEMNKSLAGGKEYIFTITLDTIKFSSQFIRNLGLFTSNSNTAERVIIDTVPVFASLALTSNFPATSPTLEIVENNVVITKSSVTTPVDDGTIFPFDTFNLSLTLKLNGIVTMDSIILFSYPTNVVTPPDQITSEALSDTDYLLFKVKGTLALKQFSDGMIQITGLQEDLINGRQIKITLLNWTARDNIIGTAKDIGLWVYYKNTYVAFSYSSANVFLINQATITMKVDQKDKFDIYSGAAWPLRFEFTTNTDLLNENYVVIQHANARDNASTWNFSAATCDFSENSANVLPTALGQRPFCAPLVNDHKYSTASTTSDYSGSGVFFRLPRMLTSVTYSFTIWGIADKCAATGDNQFNPLTPENSSIKFTFKMTVYKYYDPTKLGIERFERTTSENVILAKTAANVEMSSTCWNTQRDNIDYSNSSEISETLMYKEFTFFHLVKGTVSSGYPLTGIEAISSSDYYTLDSSRGNISPYKLIAIADFSVAASTPLKAQFPYPVREDLVQLPGKVYGYISRQFFEDGPTNCHLSWGFYINTNTLDTRRMLPEAPVANISTDGLTIDSSGLVKPSQAQSQKTGIIIPSVFHLGSATFTVSADQETICTPLTGATSCSAKFGISTNCALVPNNISPILSFYTALDIQFVYKYGESEFSTDFAPIRVVRLVKMLPELLVWNSNTSLFANSQSSLLFHYAFGVSSSKNGVCIVELVGAHFTNFVLGASQNYIYMTLYNMNLLDVDYSTYSNIYPVMSYPTGQFTALGYNNAITLTSSSALNSFAGAFVGTTDNTNLLYLLSSTVLINNPSYLPQNSKLLIPTMCPFAGQSLNQFYFPVITVGLVNINNANGAITLPIKQFKSESKIYSSFSAKSGLLTGDTSVKVTPRFTSYSSSSNTNRLHYFLGTIKDSTISSSPNTFQSAYTTLLKKDITINTSTAKFAFTYEPPNETLVTPYFYINPNNQFFVMGKSFSHVVAAIYNTGIYINEQASANTSGVSNVYLSNITRPSAEYFYKDKLGAFVTSDVVGFYATSTGNINTSPYYLTNFVNDVGPLSDVFNFILDFNPERPNFQNMGVFSNDKSTETLFQNDYGANFKYRLTLPFSGPVGSLITLENKVGNFSPSTLCGIVDQNSSGVDPFALQCSLSLSKSYQQFECPVTTSASTFTICCYNVQLTNEVIFSKIALNYPLNPAIKNLSVYVSSDVMISDSEEGQVTWQTSSSSFMVVGNLPKWDITKYEYIYVSHENGIGRLNMEITLPRQLTRDSRLAIAGDFTQILIPEVYPQCTVSLNSKLYDFGDMSAGDSLIEACSTVNLGKKLDSLVIRTRRIIYKCGMSIGNVIHIGLWPVINANLSASLLNVSLKTSATGKNLIKNNEYQTIRNIIFSPAGVKPLTSGLWGSLCNVVSIFPRLTDEVAYYDFEFDLFSNRNTLAAQLPNEFTIFFPTDKYSINVSTLSCLYQNNKFIKIICSSEINGVLTLRFLSNILVTQSNPIIRVIGIINPGADDTIIFPCTVNYLSDTGLRTNLLTGSGTLLGGIGIPSTAIGNLLLLNFDSMLSNFSPRTFGILTLKVTFDTANGALFPVTIGNTPMVIVTFPKQYNFSNLNILTMTATLEEWINNEYQVPVLSEAISIAKVDHYHNSILIVLTENSRNIQAKFRYWKIVLTNVPAPYDEVRTSMIKVTITNKIFSVLYRTFGNLYTLTNTLLPSQLDEYIRYTVGFYYQYDNTKYIVDVVNSEGKLNALSLTPGIFRKFKLVVRENKKLVVSAGTEISLLDNTFKTGQDSYTLLTSIGSLEITLGTSCNTKKGYYFISFIMTNTAGFLMIPPVEVYVDTVNPNQVNVSYNPEIPPGSSTQIFLKLSDYNFDQLSISWIGDSGNDSSAFISSVEIPAQTLTSSATFSITNPNVTKKQKFTANNPSSCFTLTQTSLEFSMISSYPDFSKYIADPESLKKNFYYYNSAAWAHVKKNAINVEYTPPVDTIPSYLYCAIVCYEGEFPEDYEILSAKSKGLFFNSFISSQAKIVFNFENIMRGRRYKIRCLLQSSQTDRTARQIVNLDFEEFKYSPVGMAIPGAIVTTKQDATQCMKFTFLKDPGALRNILLNYCTTAYSGMEGCIVCMDSKGTTIPGTSTKAFVGCSLTNDSTARYAQIISSSAPFGRSQIQGDNVIYTVCAVQDIFCESDVKGQQYTKIFDDMFSKLRTPSLMGLTLSVPVPALVDASRYTDDYPPEVDKISVSNIIVKGDGQYSFSIYNPNPVWCYWLISSYSISNFTFDDIMSCTDTSRCGNIKFSNSKKALQSTNQKMFLPGKYSLWMACFNDIPNPNSRGKVIRVASFTVDALTSNIITDSEHFLHASSILLIVLTLFFI